MLREYSTKIGEVQILNIGFAQKKDSQVSHCRTAWERQWFFHAKRGNQHKLLAEPHGEESKSSFPLPLRISRPIFAQKTAGAFQLILLSPQAVLDGQNLGSGPDCPGYKHQHGIGHAPGARAVITMGPSGLLPPQHFPAPPA